MTHQTLIYAHRGARREAAENTRPAFDRALHYPIDGIETDIQLTRDEIAVLWHDEFLGKLGLPDQRIGDLDYAQLQQMNFAAHFSPNNGDIVSAMTLEAFIAAYRARCRLLLEVKIFPADSAARRATKMRQTLQFCGTHHERVLMSSFDLDSLIYTHRIEPTFPLLYNFEPEQTLRDAQHALAEHPFLTGLCLPIATLDAAKVKLLRDQGKTIGVYTCNSDEEINRALKLQVDILITDLPQKALAMRGQAGG